MRRPRITLIAVLLALPLLLAPTMIGTTRIRIITFLAGGGNVTTDIAISNDNGDASFYYACGGIGPCRPICGNCHSNGQDRSNEVFTAARHQQMYFSRAAMSLPENQQFAWGESGSYLISRNGRLEYALKDGTVQLSAPPGSLLLKGSNGSPIGLYMPTEPKLFAKPR